MDRPRINMECDVRTSVSLAGLQALLNAQLGNPTEVLGPQTIWHEGRRMLAVRAFLPETQQAWVEGTADQTARPMRRIHPAGLFEAICPLETTAPPARSPRAPSGQSNTPANYEPANSDQLARYQLRLADYEGQMQTAHDPYAFASFLSDFDLHLFGEGKMLRCYEKFGAQVREVDGVRGTNFAVWAPNAQNISVVGDFNRWDGRRHP